MTIKEHADLVRQWRKSVKDTRENLKRIEEIKIDAESQLIGARVNLNICEDMLERVVADYKLALKENVKL